MSARVIVVDPTSLRRVLPTVQDARTIRILPTGLPGADGDDGVGSVWLSGAGVPDDGDGDNSDMYLRTSNGDVYQKAAGAWGAAIGNIMGPTGAAGAAGAAGANGADGATIRSGSGAPAGGLGANGDYYLDTATGDFYFKAAGSYSVVFVLTGPAGATGSTGSTGAAGADGSVWREGTGAPSAGLGANGDFYLNDANGDVYQKAGGSYSFVANIIGPTGATGSQGIQGIQGIQGPQGDPGHDGADGAAGATGAAGADGQDGGLKYQFNTSTSGDPGSGKFLFNNGTFGSATAFHISETDGNSNAVGALLASLDDGTGTNRIFVHAQEKGGGSFFSFYVTAALSDQGPYDTWAITPITSGGSASNNGTYVLTFVPLQKGDTGPTGAAGADGSGFDPQTTIRAFSDFTYSTTVGPSVSGVDYVDGQFVVWTEFASAQLQRGGGLTGGKQWSCARFASGSTATGTIGINARDSDSWGDGIRTIKAGCFFQQLSNGTQGFEVLIGAGSAVKGALADHSSFVGFRYTHSASGGSWEAVTKTGGNTTTTDTGSALGTDVAANTVYSLKITVNAALSSVTFHINGVLVATHTTNIPATSVGMASGAWATKTIGTTDTAMLELDYMEVTQAVSSR